VSCYGTSKCSAEFDVVWIRNAKDIAKYIAKRSTWALFCTCIFH